MTLTTESVFSPEGIRASVDFPEQVKRKLGSPSNPEEVTPTFSETSKVLAYLYDLLPTEGAGDVFRHKWEASNGNSARFMRVVTPRGIRYHLNVSDKEEGISYWLSHNDYDGYVRVGQSELETPQAAVAAPRDAMADLGHTSPEALGIASDFANSYKQHIVAQAKATGQAAVAAL